MMLLVAGSVVWIFVGGVWSVATSRNLLRTAIALSVTQSSTSILLVAVGYRAHATAPIFVGIPPTAHAVDPVVQALAFVDIVVEAVVVALLVSLGVQAARRHGTLDPDRLVGGAGE
jgi:multicomponent Na+:H+ antiporter subunit C